MMNPMNQYSGSWVIVLSLIIAFLLTAMPLPEWVIDWRPAWIVIVLIYWCMAIPERIGIGLAWGLGLLLDVQQGTVLGQNALGLAVVAYITLKSYQRIRVFPLAQQAMLISCYVMIFQLVLLWIKSMMGIPQQNWTFLLPAISSAILWPWLFIILRDVRRKYRVA